MYLYNINKECDKAIEILQKVTEVGPSGNESCHYQNASRMCVPAEKREEPGPAPGK